MADSQAKKISLLVGLLPLLASMANGSPINHSKPTARITYAPSSHTHPTGVHTDDGKPTHTHITARAVTNTPIPRLTITDESGTHTYYGASNVIHPIPFSHPTLYERSPAPTDPPASTQTPIVITLQDGTVTTIYEPAGFQKRAELTDKSATHKSHAITFTLHNGEVTTIYAPHGEHGLATATPSATHMARDENKSWTHPSSWAQTATRTEGGAHATHTAAPFNGVTNGHLEQWSGQVQKRGVEGGSPTQPATAHQSFSWGPEIQKRGEDTDAHATIVTSPSFTVAPYQPPHQSPEFSLITHWPSHTFSGVWALPSFALKNRNEEHGGPFTIGALPTTTLATHASPTHKPHHTSYTEFTHPTFGLDKRGEDAGPTHTHPVPTHTHRPTPVA